MNRQSRPRGEKSEAYQQARQLLGGSEPEAVEQERAFGGWVRTRRQSAGLSRQQFADHMGQTETWAQEIENGTRRITREEVERLATALRVSPLLCLQASGHLEGYEPDADMARMLAYCLERIPPAEHERFRLLLRQYAEEMVERIQQHHAPTVLPD